MAMDALDKLVDTVLASTKYRHVAPALVRTVGEQELAKRRNLKEAIKATKNKLHQTVGAYWDGRQAYADWLAVLQAAPPTQDGLRATCHTIMAHHASTRERLPLLHEFYTTLFADLPPVRSVLDLACGLNPLTVPWMPLAPDAIYHARDIDAEQMAFVQQALPLLGVQGTATVGNLLQPGPLPSVDVILLFKAIPCLEQLDKAIGARLLATLHAPVLFISYPAQSLGGRNKGMLDFYASHFGALVADSQRQVEQFIFDTEIVFRLR